MKNKKIQNICKIKFTKKHVWQLLTVESQPKINKNKIERYFILMKLLAHQKYKTFMNL